MFDLIKKITSDQSADDTLDANDPLTQLSVVYGEKKSKIILKKIKELKKQNPGKKYSFIFDEHGEFVAIEKKKVKG
jgi:hypothetical protein